MTLTLISHKHNNGQACNWKITNRNTKLETLQGKNVLAISIHQKYFSLLAVAMKIFGVKIVVIVIVHCFVRHPHDRYYLILRHPMGDWRQDKCILAISLVSNYLDSWNRLAASLIPRSRWYRLRQDEINQSVNKLSAKQQQKNNCQPWAPESQRHLRHPLLCQAGKPLSHDHSVSDAVMYKNK